MTIREVPARDAPFDERRQAFDDLALQSGQQTQWFEGNRRIGATFDFVLMGDSTRISDPRDLLPAVDAQSMTAKHVANFERHSAVASRIERLSLLIGLSAMVASVLTGALVWSDSQSPRGLGSAILFGGGGLSALSLAFIPVYSSSELAMARDDRVSAFLSFNKSLAERLDLKRADELAPPPMPPPEPPRPTLPPSQASAADAPRLLSLRP